MTTFQSTSNGAKFIHTLIIVLRYCCLLNLSDHHSDNSLQEGVDLRRSTLSYCSLHSVDNNYNDYQRNNDIKNENNECFYNHDHYHNITDIYNAHHHSNDYNDDDHHPFQTTHNNYKDHYHCNDYNDDDYHHYHPFDYIHHNANYHH
ncbi:unnamed protein product [Heligmosomoides polygyrus]|uniref:Histidine-rich glycoprotein-like n=1 Tax=Heligmosomoides polygyrus TaxID=6339 RepID=A0A183FSI6_HELPZ|nr:unnamed protein product [Heligmosomoides polygyrus]